MYKIGIDLSSTATGICILNDSNQIIDYEIFLFKRKFKYDVETLFYLDEEYIRLMSNWIKAKLPIKKQFCLAIELSNFVNPNTTNRFFFIAGMLYSYFNDGYVSKLKLFNAAEWFRMLYKDTYNKPLVDKEYERKQRKEMSINLFLKHTTHNQLSKIPIEYHNDIADAFWIAYYCERANDFEQQKEIKKYKKKIVEYNLKEQIKHLKKDIRKWKKLSPKKNKSQKN